MIISNKFKLLFVHIPKNGGGSIKKSIIEADYKAFKYIGYHRSLTKGICDKFPFHYKFTVVRNSWEAIESFYRYFVVRKNLDISFDYFLKEKLAKRKRFPKQLCYIGGKDNILVDQIINYDNLKEEYSKLCSKIGMPCYLTSKSHSTKKLIKESYYTKELVDLVYEICKEDIEYFKFDCRVL